MAADVGPSRIPDAPRVNQWGLAAYWVSLNFESAALLTIVVPETLTRLAAANRTADLARLAALTAVLAMVVPPIVGVWSDRLRARGVRRLAWVLTGTLVNAVGFLLVLQARTLPVLTLTLLLALTGQGAATAGYQAMMPEVVPRDRWGLASGYMGLATLVGTIGGLAVAGLLPATVVYRAMVVVAVAGALVTALSVREPRVVAAPAPVVRIRSMRRFFWVFLARFWVLFGQTLLMTFVLYFFEEVLKVRQAAGSTALVAGLAMVGAGLSTFFIGRASDRRDRARVVAFAGLPMAAAATGFGLFPVPSAIYGLAIVWGVGYGAFLSVDWALALDSIPDLANVARDLGIWGIASNLPAVVAPLVGAAILAHYASPVTGYRALFVAAGLSFLLGSVLVWPLRQRRHSGREHFLLRLAVAGLLKAYVSVAYRVRVVGRLPRPRRGILVIGNHFHDLEGMVIPQSLFWADPLGGAVISAGSRRLFEPGFLASRSPRWLGRWLAPVNLGRVLHALGVRPIENTPLHRPLVSWAYAVYRRHGNLRLDQVFSPDARASLPAGARLRDLWRPGRFPQEGPWVGHTALREPYRSEIRDALREGIETELATLRAALGAGHTLYLTPEGRMSDSGRMGRLRVALDVLWPAASRVSLVATACDPWAHRRLSLYVRLVPGRERATVRTDLLRERPVTLAHLLATVLMRYPTGGSVADLRTFVTSLRAAVASEGAWLTPEARQADRHLARALRELRRRGILVLDGDTFRPGPTRHDPRFPHVPDVVAALAQQLAETREALHVAAV
jgi:MFS family permease